MTRIIVIHMLSENANVRPNACHVVHQDIDVRQLRVDIIQGLGYISISVQVHPCAS